MSIVWLQKRSEPVPAVQWDGYNAKDIFDITEGEFVLEVSEDESAAVSGLLIAGEVPLGHFVLLTAEGWIPASPEYIRSHYDAL